MFKSKLVNNKGFTTVEVVLSFALVVVILASMTALVVNYRERVTNEEVTTQLIDFKNTITKVIYDDITRGVYTEIAPCTYGVNGLGCIQFSGSETNKLEIKKETGTSGISKGIYFEYKGIKYFLPDSDLNDYNTGEYIVDVGLTRYSNMSVSPIYGVQIPIHHNGINKDFFINLIVGDYNKD